MVVQTGGSITVQYGSDPIYFRSHFVNLILHGGGMFAADKIALLMSYVPIPCRRAGHKTGNNTPEKGDNSLEDESPPMAYL